MARAWLFPLQVGSRLSPGSWWMEFQYVINGVLLYAQGLSGFTKDCEPLEGEAHLVSRPWNPCPYCQHTPAPPSFPWTEVGGGCEVEDFPDSNCKAPHFDFPWWEERPGLCFPWLQPRLKENVGSKTAPQSHLPHTHSSSQASYIILVGPICIKFHPLTFQMSISLQVFRKQTGDPASRNLASRPS